MATGEFSRTSTLVSLTDEYLAADLSRRFQEDGMLAYVNEVQRKEKAIGCDVLTHQKWCVMGHLLSHTDVDVVAGVARATSTVF